MTDTFDPEAARLIARQMGQQQAAQHMVGTENLNPELARQAIKVAPQLGVPPETIMDDPTVAIGMARSNSDRAILNTAPDTQRWVARSPANAAAAQGDVENLARIEHKWEPLANNWRQRIKLIPGLSGRFFEDSVNAEGQDNFVAHLGAQGLDAIGGALGEAFGNITDIEAMHRAGRPVSEQLGHLFGRVGTKESKKGDLLHIPGTNKTLDFDLGTAQRGFGVATSPFAGLFEAGIMHPAEKAGVPRELLEHAFMGLGAGEFAAKARPVGELPGGPKGEAGGPKGPVGGPHFDPTEGFKTTSEGFVADIDGNPVQFNSAKEAAVWAVKEGQALSPVGQMFEPAVHPTEEGLYTVKETMRDTRPAEEVVVAEPGDNVVADAIHAAEAERNVQHIEDLAAAVKASAQASTPEVMSDFLKNSPVGNQIVYLPESVVQELYMNERKSPGPGDGLLGDVPQFVQDWRFMSNTGQSLPMFLADWLAYVHNQPWAKDLLPHLRLGNGISMAEAENIKALYDTGVQSQTPQYDIEPHVEGLEPDEAAFIREAAPAMQQAAGKVARQIFLHQLFEDGKAIGLTKPMFERYSAKLEAAQKAIFEALVKKAHDQIKRQRSKTWRESYGRHLTAELDRLATSPVVKASTLLREDVIAEMKALLDTKLVDDNGNPMTFYRGHNEPLHEGDHFRPKTFDGISLAEKPTFASEWIGGKNAPPGAVVYITHVIAKNPADFRNPADVAKMFQAFKELYPTAKDASRAVDLGEMYNTWEQIENALNNGAWSFWEHRKAFELAGFDAVRMKEAHQPREQPNVFVPHGDQIVFKYVDSFIQKMNLKFDPADLKLYPEHLRKGVAKNMIASGEATLKVKPFVYDAPGIGELTDLKKVAEKTLGSNPGAIYKDSNGNEWLVKGDVQKVHGSSSPEVSADRARNEMLASELANAALPGSAAEVRLVQLGNEHGGGLGVASKMIPNAREFDVHNPADVAAAARLFALHAWLGNRDVVGLDFDNIIMVGDEAVAIDTGGALKFRAMGIPKTYFSREAVEWDTLRDDSMNANAARVFGGMSETQLRESASVLQQLPDSKIKAIVNASGMTNASELADILIVRRDDILQRVGLDKPKEAMVSSRGMSVDDVAEALGYSSGEALLKELAVLEEGRQKGESFKKQILRMAKEAATDATHAEHGNLLDPEELEKAALEAVTSPQVEDLLHEEMAVLAEKLGTKPLTKEQITAHVDEKFSNLPIRQALRHNEFMRSVSMSAREAEAALLRDNEREGLIKAFLARQNQVIAQQMLKRSIEFRDKFRVAMKQMQSLAQKTEVEGLNNEWLDQIHGILKDVGMRLRRSDENLAQELRTSLDAFIQAKMNLGHDIYAFTNYPRRAIKDHSVDEFLGVADMIDSLKTAGRTETDTLARGERMKVEDIVKAAVESIKDRDTEITRSERRYPSLFQEINGKRRAFDAWLLRNEQFVLDLVKGDQTHPLNMATSIAFHERLGWLDDQRTAMQKKFAGLKLGKKFNLWLDQKIDVPDIVDAAGDVRFERKRDILGAFLYWGNELDAGKLVEGYDTTHERMEELFREHITPDAAKYAQAVWDFYESHWPEIVRQYRARGGKVPTKKTSRPVNGPWGELKGGYTHLHYDASLIDKAKMKEIEFDEFRNKNGYGRALPSNAYTKEVTNFVGPVSLDLDLLVVHMEQMLHDLAFRDVVMDMQKVMLDPRILAAIERHYGPEYVGSGGARIKSWIDDIAAFQNRDMRTCHFIHRLLNGANRNAMINMVGYSIKTALKHGTSALANSLVEVGPQFIGGAAKDLLLNMPIEVAEVMKLSSEVRNRLYSSAEGMRETMADIVMPIRTGAVDKAIYAATPEALYNALTFGQRHAMIITAMADQASAVLVWKAAVKEIRAEHPELSETDVHALADQRVRQAHGSSNAYDRPDAFRYTHSIPGEVWKRVTRFGTFFNHMYNRIRGIPGKFVSGTKKFAAGDMGGGMKDYGQGIAQMFGYIILIAGVEQAVEGEWKKDHGFIENMIHGEAKFMVSLVPSMRNVWHIIEQVAEGHRYGKVETGIELVDAMIDNLNDAEKAMKGDVPSDWIKHAFQSAGFAFGIPGYQSGRTLQFLWDGFHSGSDLTLGDWAHGLSVGENPELREKLGKKTTRHRRIR